MEFVQIKSITKKSLMSLSLFGIFGLAVACNPPGNQTDNGQNADSAITEEDMYGETDNTTVPMDTMATDSSSVDSVDNPEM